MTCICSSDDGDAEVGGSSTDDEETIAQAEKDQVEEVDAEVALLQQEVDLDLDDLLPPGYLEERQKQVQN